MGTTMCLMVMSERVFRYWLVDVIQVYKKITVIMIT